MWILSYTYLQRSKKLSMAITSDGWTQAREMLAAVAENPGFVPTSDGARLHVAVLDEIQAGVEMVRLPHSPPFPNRLTMVFSFSLLAAAVMSLGLGRSLRGLERRERAGKAGCLPLPYCFPRWIIGCPHLCVVDCDGNASRWRDCSLGSLRIRPQRRRRRPRPFAQRRRPHRRRRPLKHPAPGASSRSGSRRCR